MKKTIVLLLFVFLAIAATGMGIWEGTKSRNSPLEQQVYIWQRVWNEQHKSALSQSRDLFSELRILALQAHPEEGWIVPKITMPLLKQDGRPLWFVVRLDGSLTNMDNHEISEQILQKLAVWHKAGLNPVGIEIDYDSATSRLPDYLTLIQHLRTQLPKNLKISITALPDWINSPSQLRALLQETDSSVLQVHAVLSADKGLFNATLANRWITRYSKLTPNSFFVALPAYSMAIVGYDESGAIVESEVPLRINTKSKELTVDPEIIANFMQHLERSAPPHLKGILWFRLPLQEDKRAWSLETLRAVVTQQPLVTKFSVEFLTTQPSVYDIKLQNQGNRDALGPLEIRIPASQCMAGDGINGYRYESGDDSQRFVRTEENNIAVGKEGLIGWLRCEQINKDRVEIIETH